MMASTLLLCVVISLLPLASTTSNSPDATIQYIDLLVLIPWQPLTDKNFAQFLGAKLAINEINDNHIDLLPPGYKLRLIEADHDSCSLPSTSTIPLGLLNIVRHTIMKNRVAAIMGLYCTMALSDFASIPQLSILQFSAANSPIFNQDPDKYRHLWRFLQSAEVYSDLVKHLMVENDWQRIAVVSSEGDRYHGGIAEDLIKKVLLQDSMKIVYHGQLIESTNSVITELMLEEIVANQSRIVFVTAKTDQIVSFLCLAHQKGMVYPNYLWILPDQTLDKLTPLTTCGDGLIKSLEGSVMAVFNILPENLNSKFESSGISYNEYLQEYSQELARDQYKDPRHSKRLVHVNVINSTTNIPLTNAAFLYDQVWAFTLAVNKSKSELLEHNITTLLTQIPRTELTNILEKQLRNMSFIGATGDITFNELREVKTPIDVHQVRNGVMKVGVSRVIKLNGSLNLVFSDQLDDHYLIMSKEFPTIATVVLAMGVVCVFVMVTLVLACLIKHRNLREVKAISLKLGFLIFIACYCLIINMVFLIVLDSVQLSTFASTFICYVKDIITCNSYTLILITLYLQLRRIYRIFYNHQMRELGRCYDTWAIALQAIIYTVTPNVLYIALVIAYPNKQVVKTIKEPRHSATGIIEYEVCNLFNPLYHIPLLTEFLVLSVLNIYLASKLTKIPARHFSDTRYVNLLIVFLFITKCIMKCIVVIYTDHYPGVFYANIVCYSSTALNILYCQCFLFVPVLYKIWRRKWLKKYLVCMEN